MNESAEKKMEEALEHGKNATQNNLEGAARGNFPAERTSRYKESIDYEMKKKTSGPIGGVGSTDQKAHLLEKGTIKTRKYPAIRTTLTQEARAIKRILGSRWF
ncbi:hypothetical protein MWH25_01415 [Natroniella acetigena]|uniref:HK97 gp10 family phage protein n=1 Tax=Natroniella acetigena TaxID=52004 RepID=UPI00200A3BA7|nr:HK97 gp10 family phage protein [Natroniella acetigena]MCK8826406.1 hypothetical protein [Natroniella acetigena]